MNSVHLTLNWRRTVREFPFNSSPSKTFWDELKGDQPIIVLHFSVHSPWTSFSYMKSMNNDRLRSMIIDEAMNIDRYDHWSYWFMHECAVHAMKGYWSCMKTFDHSYEQALIMHDNVHIHVIMNIIMTPNLWGSMWQINVDKLSIYGSLSIDLKFFAHIFPKMACFC